MRAAGLEPAWPGWKPGDQPMTQARAYQMPNGVVILREWIPGRVLPPLITVLQTIAFVFRHRECWSVWLDSNQRSPASKAGRDGQAPLQTG